MELFFICVHTFSPVNGTAQQYVGSQFDLVKSLGVNDSTLSWTSSLATPNHADLEDRGILIDMIFL